MSLNDSDEKKNIILSNQTDKSPFEYFSEPKFED